MRKRNLKKFVLSILCIVFALAISLGHCVIAICIAFLIAFLICNDMIKKKQNKQRIAFGIYSDIRNVDCLVIGDIVNLTNIIPIGRSFIQITAVGRSLEASYEILKHTSSILRENGGEVYLVTDENIQREKFSVFDIQWLHPITILKYNLFHLERKTRFPLFFAPVKSLRFLLNIYKSGQILESQLPDDNLFTEIAGFCQARDFKLHIVTVC